MNTESVMEFLSGVSLLQSLPRSSLLKIALLVTPLYFGPGEHVVREGDAGLGIYFILEGEAEVSSVSDVDENRPEFILKRHDYFGCGMEVPSAHADVIALTKLTCLVLPREHSNLLQTRSIWNADQASEACSVVEQILHLEPVEALAAASKTVDCLKNVHSLHAYFILIGDLDIPIIYQVDRVRDGKSFATRRVEAIQKGKVVFSLLASFQKDEQSFDHQLPTMPTCLPDPETLLSMEELRDRRLTDPRLPKTYRTKVASKEFVPWPIDIRFCEPSTGTNMTKSPPRLRFWFRAKGKLSDDQALHRCVLAYISDLIFLQVSLNPHRRQGLRMASISLDHALWFHRPCKADDWILFNIESPTAYSGRGFVSAQMFDRKGQLVASVYQEGVFRKKPDPPTVSKL
ncbi:acyl-CoA hydrolase 2 isoform X2 [Daucus carota subsp. sativus]|uniref:acyl-CoA hydrolase 2 isoform X2 n=1 Tax=Daucus carota subsp. sativus TaxID=79200 RepID=UPI0007EF2C43|nr:PREDICTED: acyl-coenzyme A thioesterase 8-like isoform X2 [Daucus carota subsp. sativus]